MENRNPIIIKLDSLSKEDLDLISRFFSEQEANNPTSLIFEKDIPYKLTDGTTIIFDIKLIGYEKNKKEYNLAKTEWIYAAQSKERLGRGAFGEVNVSAGKLVHSTNGSMEYIKPSTKKPSYFIKLISVDTLDFLTNAKLEKINENKYPILIKDKIGDVYIYGRNKETTCGK